MSNIYKITVLFALLNFVVSLSVLAQNQSFYFGNDLSYVNQMEDCGADFKRFGISEDPFRIFADVGTNLVRVRLWVDPSWWQEPLVQPVGVKPVYNDLEDVKLTIHRARANGMAVMLDLHYSDFWADPGRQLIPRVWVNVASDIQALSDSVYNYTVRILRELDAEGLMPEIVKVGNENNGGILTQIPDPVPAFTSSQSVGSRNTWTRNAQLFNAGIRAVRDVGAEASVNPKIALHWSNLNGLESWFDNVLANGITDFDIMGFSYYYSWHQGSIDYLESRVQHMAQKHPDYEIMVVETGYLWTTQYGGIINNPDPGYLPAIPEKQLEYMVDYTRAVKRAGGTGVIFWEPAWVDTPCRTPWIRGSSHTGVAFFHPSDYNFMENGGGHWTQPIFFEDTNDKKVTFRVSMAGQEISEAGVYITGSFTGQPWSLIKMANEGGDIFSFFSYLPEGAEGAYYFLNGDEWTDRETVPEDCAVWEGTNRGYIVGNSDLVIESDWEKCTDISVPGIVTATFQVDMTGEDVSRGVYITGHIVDWEIEQMEDIGNFIYEYAREIETGNSGAYYYMTTGNWTNYMNFRESVPSECAGWYGTDRGYTIPEEDVFLGFVWGTCDEIDQSVTSMEALSETYQFRLLGNYPNPFNPSTIIRFEIPVATHVEIRLYDLLGREVSLLFNEARQPGIHEVNFNGNGLSSGIYVYRMQTDEFIQTKKLTLLK